jgi:large subunit ribosomal protein L3
MVKAHQPRSGSMQYWPRKRAKRELARVNSWAKIKEAKPLGFIGYKAGMVHISFLDNRPKSMTKDEEISFPVTVIECPTMKVAGINFYEMDVYGLRLRSTVLSDSMDKELGRKISLPKNVKKKVEDVKDFDEIRLLVYTQPKLIKVLGKKPKIGEVALGGKKEEQLKFAQEKLGKEISVEEVFKEGDLLDAHGVTKGKGFQGTVKRYGVSIRSHKSEKVKRGAANLGAWTPSRVSYRQPLPGKMGYHLRTDFNKWLMKIGKNGKEVTPKSGFPNYGIIKNDYVLIKGSLPGPRKRVITLTQATRPNRKVPKEAPQIKYILK